MLSLPIDALFLILAFLEPPELSALCCTCRPFHDLVREPWVFTVQLEVSLLNCWAFQRHFR